MIDEIGAPASGAQSGARKIQRAVPERDREAWFALGTTCKVGRALGGTGGVEPTT
jgi:hypothetical protein